MLWVDVNFPSKDHMLLLLSCGVCYIHMGKVMKGFDSIVKKSFWLNRNDFTKSVLLVVPLTSKYLNVDVAEVLKKGFYDSSDKISFTTTAMHSKNMPASSKSQSMPTAMGQPYGNNDTQNWVAFVEISCKDTVAVAAPLILSSKSSKSNATVSFRH